MKKIVILFGGVSAEHEVSVITGLQVVEKIDKSKFTPYAIKLGQDGLFYYYSNLSSRRQYPKTKPEIVYFGRDENGAFFSANKLLKSKTYIDATYLAFHGGNGEAGQIQGLLEVLNIPFTSPNTETSSISMNKVITKQILVSSDIPIVDGMSIYSEDIKKNVDETIKKIRIGLPVIIKPAHLGSSIGINIAKTKIELKKYLLEASHVDSEILIEKLMKNFNEYNISVRKINGYVEVSEIERPLPSDEILSFADKYQKGGKKNGGMASLSRELPAHINSQLKKNIENYARDVFKAIRAKGMIRIDFMVCEKNVYVTEVNPIPGSMAYYLWEASGISFKDQITELINQAVMDNETRNSYKLEYHSDIVERFVSSKGH